MKKALVMIDLQNDFCKGGRLAVPEADRVIQVANKWQLHFDHVLATQDWHPPNHGCFAVNHPLQKVGDQITLNGLPQILWPTHCVQETDGARFHPQLNTQRIEKIIHKGTDELIDSYSAFYDNAQRHETALCAYLRSKQISELYMLGLATDYCVKFSVLDAIKLGFKVHVVVEGCRGVNLNPHDADQALIEMQAGGAHLIAPAGALSNALV